ncbi:MAG: hypothetical protein GY870_13015 [archaeon]|nr:hypothetical protein [archaeon]
MVNKTNAAAAFIFVIIVGGIGLLSLENGIDNGGNGNSPDYGDAIIANHYITNWTLLQKIPDSAIIQAKNSLNISYGHTSHGSQIPTGMDGLSSFMEGRGVSSGLYNWFDGVDDNSSTLNLDDYGMSGDLGNSNRTIWANRTRTYLDSHPYCNVIMWSWCGQVDGTEEQIADYYLANMNMLELEYPNVKFIYMTGHVYGTGLMGNIHIRNEQIRDYCKNNDKILYDFADIESYNLNGTYFGDKNVTDNCNYNGGNWAEEWAAAYPSDYYSCSAAHSHAVNGNMKAYAAWWMFARIAGWDGTAK